MDHDRLIQQLRGLRRIVINAEHGGFSLSAEAKMKYLERAGLDYSLVPREDRHSTQQFGPYIEINGQYWSERDINRDDPALVAVIEEMGEAANGRFATLKIVEVPADVDWQINEYDGWEWVAEKHRTWR